MQYYTALRVSDLLDMNRHGCDMNALDNIARRAVGDLKRAENHVLRDPFIEGKNLMAKAQSCVNNFSYINRLNLLWSF